MHDLDGFAAQLQEKYDNHARKGRAVQDYNLYWIHIDYFKKIQLQYVSDHIFSIIVIVEYDIITL